MAKPETQVADAVDVVLDDWRRERPEMDVSTMGVFGRLSRVFALQRGVHDAQFHEQDLTLASFDVLANLRRSAPDVGKTAGELARSSMLTTGGITFRLDRMEAQKLIERVRTREDRRLVYAKLTTHGKDVVDRALEQHLDAQKRMLSGLTAGEIEQLSELLRKVECSISESEEVLPEPIGTGGARVHD